MAGNTSVTDQVVSYIQQNIENGTWPVGSKLPSESQFCSRLGVSRTSVRSALQQFIAIGAVESIHGKGTFVRSADLSRLCRPGILTFETLQDALRVCALIRPTICVQAMQSGDTQLLPDLRKILDRMHTLNPDQLEELADLSNQFYSRISAVFKNGVLDSLRDQLTAIMQHFALAENDNVFFHGTLYYHSSMLEALEHQDAERLAVVIRNYYTNMITFYQSPVSSDDSQPE